MDTTPLPKIILYSFTAGYMVSELNILGFTLGCGFMFALQYVPLDVTKFNLDTCTTLYKNLLQTTTFSNKVEPKDD